MYYCLLQIPSVNTYFSRLLPSWKHYKQDWKISAKCDQMLKFLENAENAAQTEKKTESTENADNPAKQQN